MAKPLLARQKAFVSAYAECLNGAEAARRAGYKPGKYPVSVASKLLADPRIRSEVDRLIAAQVRMAPSEILARLERQATASVALFLKPGSLEIDMDAVHAHGDLIQSIWFTAEGPRLRLHDSQKALELLGKARALFVERQIIGELEDMDIVEDEHEAAADPRPRAPRKAKGD